MKRRGFLKGFGLGALSIPIISKVTIASGMPYANDNLTENLTEVDIILPVGYVLQMRHNTKPNPGYGKWKEINNRKATPFLKGASLWIRKS